MSKLVYLPATGSSPTPEALHFAPNAEVLIFTRNFVLTRHTFIGMGQYACSDQPNWNSLKTYVDNSQPGSQVVQKVEVVLTGSYGCTAPVNTVIVGVKHPAFFFVQI